MTLGCQLKSYAASAMRMKQTEQRVVQDGRILTNSLLNEDDGQSKLKLTVAHCASTKNMPHWQKHHMMSLIQNRQ